MASIWKRPNSKFWSACYTDQDGKRIKHSTKQTQRRKALGVALELERVEQQARRDLRMKLTGHSSVGMNDRYTHHAMKPLEQAISELPSFNEEAGADGCLLKRTTPEDLRAAMLDLLGGGAPMTSEIARRMVESFRRAGKQQKPTIHLTPREEEVLILLSKGCSNKEIANQLAIGTETVGTHLKHIYEKMHVPSRAAAVARYLTSRA